MKSCFVTILFNLLRMPLLKELHSDSLHVFDKQPVRWLDWAAVYHLFTHNFKSIILAYMPSRNALIVGKGSVLQLVWEDKAVFISVKHFFGIRVVRNIFASLLSIIAENYLAENAAFSHSCYLSHFIIFVKLSHCCPPRNILRPWTLDFSLLEYWIQIHFSGYSVNEKLWQAFILAITRLNLSFWLAFHTLLFLSENFERESASTETTSPTTPNLKVILPFCFHLIWLPLLFASAAFEAWLHADTILTLDLKVFQFLVHLIIAQPVYFTRNTIVLHSLFQVLLNECSKIFRSLCHQNEVFHWKW